MWAEACAMIERAEQLHRQFFEPTFAAVPKASWEPPIDVFEDEREFSIIAALPGVEPKDVEISVEAGTLIVAGIRDLPAIARGTVIHRLEIPHGRFERRVRLPVGTWKLERSSLANGCLRVSLMKGY
jgi:HSP20 family molecular chaperone IbpA